MEYLHQNCLIDACFRIATSFQVQFSKSKKIRSYQSLRMLTLCNANNYIRQIKSCMYCVNNGQIFMN